MGLCVRSTCAARVLAIILALSATSVAEDSVTFLVPRDAFLFTNSGRVPVRVKSITASEAIVIIKDGSEKAFPLTSFNVLQGADGSFKFSPAKQTFPELLDHMSKIGGVNVVRSSGSVDSGDYAVGRAEPPNPQRAYAQAIGMQTVVPSSAGGASGGFAANGGFAGPSLRPQPLARFELPANLDTDAGANAGARQPAEPATGSKPGAPSIARSGSATATEDILICSNPKCGKEVPGAKYGEKCPYCGALWAAQSTAEIAANSTPGSTYYDPKNPFARSPGAQPENGQPAAPAPHVLPTPPTVVQAPAEFSLETLPWWGKLGCFAGAILVLWFVTQRR
jgi:hypothetical protein